MCVITPASLQSRNKIGLAIDLGTVVMLAGRYSVVVMAETDISFKLKAH